MPTFAVEYAERQSGKSHMVRLEAANRDEAAAYVTANAKDVLVGEIRDITPPPPPPQAFAPLPSPEALVQLLSTPAVNGKIRNLIAQGVFLGTVYVVLGLFALWLLLTVVPR